ncbi:MAG: hypothetical protein HDR79_07730 [Bacteroides sp.]|nr:hypothetical protein [Bacteroides sp.]
MTKEKNQRILHLVLKRKWWDMIASGEKKEEYRSLTPYWFTRLCAYKECGHFYRKVTKKDAELFEVNKDGFASSVQRGINSVYSNLLPRDFTFVTFHLGYTNTTMTFENDGIEINYGREEWGAEPDKLYFTIKLGKRI